MATPEYTLTVDPGDASPIVHQHEVDALRVVADRVRSEYPEVAGEIDKAIASMEPLVRATRIIEYIELATRIRTVRIEGCNEPDALALLATRYSEAPYRHDGFDVVDVDADLHGSVIEVIR